MRNINKIIVHCTASDPTPNVLIDHKAVEDIRKYHLSLGYIDIAYHVLIDSNGNILAGRPFVVIGAHCKGYNKDSIGIALIGGKHGFDFTAKQMDSLLFELHELCEKFHISKDNIFGHNDFTKKKTCPNFNVKNFISYESF